MSQRTDTSARSTGGYVLSRRPTFGMALFAALLLIAALAASASAVTTHSPIGSFGSDGSSATRFPLGGSATSGGNSRLAFDQANGRLAVMWANVTAGVSPSGRVCWFDSAAAEPWAPGSCIEGFYFGNSLDNANLGIAIDNSAGPSAGNLYATDFGSGPSGEPPRTHGFPPSGGHPPDDELSGFPIGQTQALYSPSGPAVDSAGHLWVADNGGDAHISRFNPDGSSAGTRIDVSNQGIPRFIAFDSEDNLYVATDTTPFNSSSDPEPGVYRYAAPAYDQNTVTEVEPPVGKDAIDVAVDTSNDHLFVLHPDDVVEYDVSSGVPVHVSTFATGLVPPGATEAEGFQGIAIDQANRRIYVSDASADRIRVFDTVSDDPVVTALAASDRSTVSVTANGSVNPRGFALSECRFEYVTQAAFEQTGFGDLSSGGSSACATADGSPIAGPGDIPADSAAHAVSAPLAGLTPATLYRYRLRATSSEGSAASAPQAFATLGPLVSATKVSAVTRTAATLGARVNPNGAATGYRFEYGAVGPCSANPCASAPAVEAPVGEDSAEHQVSQSLSDLEPDTTYFYRVLATSPDGATTGLDRSFATYPEAVEQDCANEALRQSQNATRLPECRAYELVSPAGLGGYPSMVSSTVVSHFSSNALDSGRPGVLYGVQGGTIPGTDGNGLGDQFVALRGPDGWTSQISSPSGAQAEIAYVSATDPDFNYSFWDLSSAPIDRGSLAGECNHYLRDRDNNYEFTARGSLGEYPGGNGVYISPGAAHVVFHTLNTSPDCAAAPPLEPGAPPTGTAAIYDRSPAGPTHVVSLLPGDATPAAGQDAIYEGASEDGSTIAFKLDTGPALYLRVDNLDSFEVTASPSTFAGISADGSHAFYLQGGDLYSFEPATQQTTRITETGDAEVANVSADGTRAYFVSHQQIGGQGVAGKPNLYVWERAGEQTSLVATLAALDLSAQVGIANWVSDVIAPDANQFHGPGFNASRTTPDGSTIAFQSRARLTDYDNESHTEIYRYDATDQSLLCVSCNPTGAVPSDDAALETFFSILPPALVHNLSADGNRVFFQSDDPLVIEDTDGVTDVYQWSAEGTAGCERATGCVALISSGQTHVEQDPITGKLSLANELLAVSADGHDVVYSSPDALLPAAGDGGTPVLYDARVGGGFAQEAAAPCDLAAGACEGPPSSAPAVPGAGSAVFSGPGNQPAAGKSPRRRCPKGKRRVRRRGKVRCVKRQRHQRHRRHGHHRSQRGGR